MLEKSHTSIMRWEQKLANQPELWSPEAPAGAAVTIEGDVALIAADKTNTEGLQRAFTAQRFVQNWVRPHGGLGKNQTPVMAIGLYHRPISMLELLSLRSFTSLML